MLDNTYFRLALLIGAAFLLYYLVTMNRQTPVQNDGTMSVDIDSDDGSEQGDIRNNMVNMANMANTNMANMAGVGTMAGVGAITARDMANLQNSAPAVSQPGSCPTIARIGMPKRVLNSQVQSVDDPTCDYQMLKNNANVLPYPQVSNNYAPQIDVNQQLSNTYTQQQVKQDCFPKDQLVAADLLPREDGFNTWQEVNPQAQGALTDQNFLEAGHHFGINTVGNSLKNANMQLRSDPVIPQVAVGPWLNSSYGPDTSRRYFEVGQC